MRKKLLGAREAIAGGVRRVLIGNASLQALLNGAGTTIEVSAAMVAAGGKE
jgi:acetylglutamate/LysW-gamma-L-alpha-aminoadipate kinase